MYRKNQCDLEFYPIEPVEQGNGEDEKPKSDDTKSKSDDTKSKSDDTKSTDIEPIVVPGPVIDSDQE